MLLQKTLGLLKASILPRWHVVDLGTFRRKSLPGLQSIGHREINENVAVGEFGLTEPTIQPKSASQKPQPLPVLTWIANIFFVSVFEHVL